jgi:DNA-binding response OmpR family regulator
LSNDTLYFKKSVDFIKKNNPYIPVIAIMHHGVILPNAIVDMHMNICMPFETFTSTVIFNIRSYVKTFSILKKLTAKLYDKIEFANCTYDPMKRILYHRVKLPQKEEGKEPEYVVKEIKKLSVKEGGILEILASNYGEVVKKEVILQKMWRIDDYFASRSMDVYLSYLRKVFRKNDIKLKITNISKIGLILE